MIERYGDLTRAHPPEGTDPHVPRRPVPVATAVDETTMTEVARRYYLGDQSKVAIGVDLGLSRFQVARLLQEARQRGIVRIQIGTFGQVDTEMSEALAAELGLQRAVVVSGSGRAEDDDVIDTVGRALARVLEATVVEGETLGVSFSRQIVAMVAHLGVLPRCDVVQLAGHLSRPTDRTGTPEIVRRIADISGGTAHPIYAPMVLPDASTARALRQQPEIRDALDRARTMDRAVVSIGGWGPGLSGVFDAVPARDQRRATGAGACGEISGRLFDARGRPVTEVIDDRVVAVTLEELRRVPQVVATCWGADRAGAAIVAAGHRFVTTLVTDDSLAKKILESGSLGRKSSARNA